MVRTSLIPKKQQVSIEVPADYVGTEVEVIAFRKNEGVEREKTIPKKVSFSAISIDTAGFRFDRNEANER
ncbi:hypothetical protein [Imperialibacter roseus]|jgi:hypothetical protein|uniref:Uncharacterized protein n=1 Tax=Imperialibacter roseus TaxID=1324217 RepID=A0ABZ0IQN4_9BACT|nr:hypothetical protein [Imperialibacter roseus]WOK07309.1 hypothetical protein RT717_01570 [Imperialibacter roseus]|tara:strand:+ start:92321 stop:92530 length:210 start_codon:yes stop_codon:yes gene_type:complete